MDNLEFLDGAPASSEVVQPEPVAEVAPTPETVEASQPTETAEEKATRERDERGRFKARETDEPVMVPLKALHETRDELKALKAELETLRQPQQQQAPQVPDMFEDPEGFQNYQTQQLQRMLYSERLNMSQRFATQQYGADTVQAAMEWGQAKCASDPAFNAAVMNNPDPVGYAVQNYQREQAFGKLGGDLKEIEAYLAWKQAQQAQPAAQAAQTQPVVRPTSSIASATSAGGVSHVAVGPGVAFDNVIK